jgi:hypothetical protein
VKEIFLGDFKGVRVTASAHDGLDNLPPLGYRETSLDDLFRDISHRCTKSPRRKVPLDSGMEIFVKAGPQFLNWTENTKVVDEQFNEVAWSNGNETRLGTMV